MLTRKDIHQLEDHFKKIFASKEDLITFKDEILGEIKAMREELAVVVGYRQHIEDHADKLDLQEERLAKNQEIIVDQQKRVVEHNNLFKQHHEMIVRHEGMLAQQKVQREQEEKWLKDHHERIKIQEEQSLKHQESINDLKKTTQEIKEIVMKLLANQQAALT